MEIPHGCRGLLMLAEHLLHPGDVVPASELVATLMEDAGHLVAEHTAFLLCDEIRGMLEYLLRLVSISAASGASCSKVIAVFST